MVDGVDNGCEDQSALLNKFLDELSITDEYTFGTGRFSWIEKTEDDELYERLKKLDDSDKELLTLLAFDGYTRREIAKIRSVSEQAIGKRIKKLKEFLFLV
jgi:DNA-directed RNA polymerase specialized sigma subunit